MEENQDLTKKNREVVNSLFFFMDNLIHITTVGLSAGGKISVYHLQLTFFVHHVDQLLTGAPTGKTIEVTKQRIVQQFNFGQQSKSYGYGSKLSTPKMDGFPTKHDHFCGSLVP